MVLIIASRLAGGFDSSTKALVDSLKSESISHCVLNPHELNVDTCLKHSGRDIDLVINGIACNPDVVYMSSSLRCDCIVRIPSSVKYPNAYRLRVHQFMQDVRFALEQKSWVPGKYENLERADSKPAVMKMAHVCGLVIPRNTVDSFKQPKTSGVLLRKNLGPPFAVSLNRKTGVEVGVTTTSVLESESCDYSDAEIWQWQTSIESIGQVRGFFVGEKVWAAIWRKEIDREVVHDLRKISQVDGNELVWHPYSIPNEITTKIRSLMKVLQIQVAAPEFLLTKAGELVFIDLNPCGDWWGFFSDQVRAEITSTLTEVIKLKS